VVRSQTLIQRRTRVAVAEAAVRRIFPSLAGQRVVGIRLDTAYRRWARAHRDRCTSGGPNPYLDPIVAAEILAEIHRAAGAEWSFGGYLEDRRHLLAGSYLEATGNFLHLGIDVHVPEGTPVVAGVPARVLLVDDDQDPNGGWGPRVFLHRALQQGDDMVGVFAHLRAPRCRPGDVLGPTDVFAEVGGPPFNGNWHPHLHLQLLRVSTFKQLVIGRLDELDGYGPPAKKRELAALFPDPVRRW
jgi:murein DD-endopeptidase MepM/ murein hydrolase activator NlpD